MTGASIGAVGAVRTATTGKRTEIMVDKRIVRMSNDCSSVLCIWKVIDLERRVRHLCTKIGLSDAIRLLRLMLKLMLNGVLSHNYNYM